MDEVSIPFDEFAHADPAVSGGPHGIAPHWIKAVLRIISFISLWLAIVTAAVLILSHCIPLITGAPLPFSLKSAIPLIAIGLSYVTLVLTLPRTPGQLLVGVLTGLAFILWGAEQFLNDRALISFIDDCVVFLFVVDLSIVIRRNFRERAAERQLRKAS